MTNELQLCDAKETKKHLNYQQSIKGSFYRIQEWRSVLSTALRRHQRRFHEREGRKTFPQENEQDFLFWSFGFDFEEGKKRKQIAHLQRVVVKDDGWQGTVSFYLRHFRLDFNFTSPK